MSDTPADPPSAEAENEVVSPASPRKGLHKRIPRGSRGGRHYLPVFTKQQTGAAARDWDFLAARPPQKRTNVIESIGHLIKSCLGGGVVAIHEAYKDAGLWISVIMNVFLGILVTWCMLILSKSAQKAYGMTKVPMMSYPDLAECALQIGPFPKLRRFSRCFRFLVDITITIDLFGSCCCYQVIIARSLKQLVENAEIVTNDASGSSPNIRVYICSLLIPCIILCMITSLKYLAPFSIVADIFIGAVAIATIVYGSSAATKSPLEFPFCKTFTGFMQFVGVCVFSMEGVGVTLPIENCMKQPRKMHLVMFGGMSVVASTVMVIGFFGYYGFGEKAKSPVTLNFPLGGVSTVFKVFMALMIYVTFALNFWVPFNLCWVYLKRRHPEEKHWIWERVYRAIIVTLITLVSIAFPEVSKLMGVIGAFCLSNMGFIYPVFIELCLDWEDPGLGRLKWRLWKFVFFFVFGLLVMTIGTTLNIIELVTSVYGTKKSVAKGDGAGGGGGGD